MVKMVSPTCTWSTEIGPCGRESVRDVGTASYCQEHVDEVVGPIWQRLALHGIGQPWVGDVPAPDGSRILSCTSCSAEWRGWPGDECEWCERRRTSMVQEQRQLVLYGSRPDPADVDGMNAWAARLAVAVAAGFVTAEEAERAVIRHGMS